MRHIFNRSAAMAVIIATAVMSGLAGAQAREWDSDAVRVHLREGAAMPLIQDSQERRDFAREARGLAIREADSRDDVLTILSAMMSDPDKGVRYEAMDGYVSVAGRFDGMRADDMLAQIGDVLAAFPDDANLHARAAAGYRAMIEKWPGEVDKIIPLLTAMIDDKNATVRVAAASSLSLIPGIVPSKGGEILDIILPLTEDEDALVRQRVTGRLTGIMIKSGLQARKGEILSVLSARSADTYDYTREMAVKALDARTFPDPADADMIFDALAARLDDTEANVRVHAYRRLADMALVHHARADAVISKLATFMGMEKDIDLRRNIILSLSDLATVLPRPVMLLLTQVVADGKEDADVRETALIMLAHMGRDVPLMARDVRVVLETIVPQLPPTLLRAGEHWLSAVRLWEKEAQTQPGLRMP